jgi:hypothetical protein
MTTTKDDARGNPPRELEVGAVGQGVSTTFIASWLRNSS